jgi:hypothetical protein
MRPLPLRHRTAAGARARAAARTLTAACVAMLAACTRPPATTTPRPAPAAAPTSAESLLEAMRARYAGRWYRTATFVQRTLLVDPRDGSERRQTWYEAMALPGRLRIDRDSTLRTGTLFANDSQYVVLNGTVRRAVPGHNVLLVLGFDVYGQPAARTAAVLAGLGFPAGPVRADRWQGRPVWVVGGAPGDERSPQYWVDQERLVFARMVQPDPANPSQAYDVRFDQYRPLGGGWIATRVEAYTGGRRTLLEEYEDVRADVTLDPALFDARQWTQARHWSRSR